MVIGAVLIVAGGFLLISERDRPEHVRRLGLALALVATIVFACRDNLVRWLSIDTDVSPGVAALATLGAGAGLMAVFVVVGRAPLRAHDARAFAPAGVLFGLERLAEEDERDGDREERTRADDDRSPGGAGFPYGECEHELRQTWA